MLEVKLFLLGLMGKIERNYEEKWFFKELYLAQDEVCLT